MSLFGNKKEKHDADQTSLVKEAASSNSNMTNNKENEQQGSFNSSNNFNNPFAQQQNTINGNFSNQNQPNLFNQSQEINSSQIPSSPFENPQNNNNNNNFNTSQSTSTIPFNQEQTNLNPENNFQQNPQNSSQIQNQPNLFNQPQEDNLNNFQQNASNFENNSLDRDKIQEMIDETVEKIIDERWEKLVTNIDKVVKWKDKVDNQMNLIKEDIVSMRDGFDELEKKLINKISNYDRNILDVNSEIKALEKVFQKITPTLVNNVNELSRIADELKTPAAKEKFQKNN